MKLGDKAWAVDFKYIEVTRTCASCEGKGKLRQLTRPFRTIKCPACHARPLIDSVTVFKPVYMGRITELTYETVEAVDQPPRRLKARIKGFTKRKLSEEVAFLWETQLYPTLKEAKKYADKRNKESNWY